jgi:hypothetical protein
VHVRSSQSQPRPTSSTDAEQRWLWWVEDQAASHYEYACVLPVCQYAGTYVGMQEGGSLSSVLDAVPSLTSWGSW